MANTFTLTWEAHEAGWATCTVGDPSGELTMMVSFLTDAPRDLIGAVQRLVDGDDEERLELLEEPAVHRWWFTRDGDDVRIRIVQVRDSGLPDSTGEEVWRSVQPLTVVARTVLRAFDHVAWQHDDDAYLERWRNPFPRRELDHLRRTRP